MSVSIAERFGVLENLGKDRDEGTFIREGKVEKIKTKNIKTNLSTKREVIKNNENEEWTLKKIAKNKPSAKIVRMYFKERIEELNKNDLDD